MLFYSSSSLSNQLLFQVNAHTILLVVGVVSAMALLVTAGGGKKMTKMNPCAEAEFKQIDTKCKEELIGYPEKVQSFEIKEFMVQECRDLLIQCITSKF